MKFFHRYAGAKFFMPNGQELAFAGGMLDTDVLFKDRPETKKQVEDELKKIADVPSSMIYTKSEVHDISETGVIDEIAAGATSSFDIVNKVPAGTQTQSLPMNHDPKPTLGGTGNDMQKAATGQPNSNSASDAVSRAREQLRAAAAARDGQGKAATPPIQPIQKA